ncbi:ArdC family protein [Sinimarinibacterium sp. NLF-5-8]|uniref:ArdC family protein n=1 Tax=Sinimarinibacterium sp. NLF-5-8 TaxID=2698684 RepID=UPI00137C0AD6|nr:zincin-like metallopeptidase domain-containing protein [Sinimarinibacterium sp. NLF-5-8]QHS09035.1 DUF1738 domain-containing protein [Sinimarinibacterium sp. NLF-5-8]
MKRKTAAKATTATDKSSGNEIFAAIAAKIVQDISQGVMPWAMPWKQGMPMTLPLRGDSGTPYRGVNILILWAQAHDKGYKDPRWYSFQGGSNAALKEDPHAERKGVRKGEKGTKVLFAKPFVLCTKAGQEPKYYSNLKDPRVVQLQTLGWDCEVRVTWKWHYVWNAEQFHGISPLPAPAAPADSGDVVADVAAHASLNDLLQQCSSELQGGLHHRGSKAYYRPSSDEVVLPPVKDFKSATGYWGTVLHELSHASGHASRLNRDDVVKPAKFGCEQYAREELVAEFGSAFVAAAMGLPYETQHAAYLQEWAKQIPAKGEAEKSAVLKEAISAAQKAADCVLNGLKVKTWEKPADDGEDDAE